MSEKELKPCPFCRGKAEIHECKHELPFSEERNIFFVRCSICGCHPFHFSEVNLYYSSDFKEHEKQLKRQAINAWNRRSDK